MRTTRRGKRGRDSPHGLAFPAIRDVRGRDVVLVLLVNKTYVCAFARGRGRLQLFRHQAACNNPSIQKKQEFTLVRRGDKEGGWEGAGLR